jgi:pyrroloquinoline quinone biosynthesis protein B
MLLRVLGAAAGGGLPQWNCACINCRAARGPEPTILPRTQSQIAVSGDGESWYLLNASPDLRQQLMTFEKAHPSLDRGIRNTPIAGAILTSADLDHTLGLLLLREFTPVRIYSTSAVHQILSANPFFRMLNRLPGQEQWNIIEDEVPLHLEGGLQITPVKLEGSAPAYALERMPDGTMNNDFVLGLLIQGQSGKRVAYFPALPVLDQHIRTIFESCDVILVDGTFWSETELQKLQTGTQGATQMGHLPIDGESGSLKFLRGLSGVRRVYTHINNTNPILDQTTAAYKTVAKAGCEIAFDGLEICF